MAIKSHISSTAISGKKSKGSGGGAASALQQGRVLHVILTENDPYCKSPGMLYGVYYNPPTIIADEQQITSFEFAYCGASDIKTIPLVGELVNLTQQPNASSLQTPGAKKTYWTSIVNVWNNPNHGAAPDTTQPQWQDTTLKGFPEQKTVNNLAANPGDLLVQGRFSQTIRMSGAKGSLPLITDANVGKPIILISNGQVETQDGISTVHEDINEDANSLYFLTDHIVPLTPASTKRNSYTTEPETADQYKGNQVVINGGRLYFNAKEESVLISAKESVGLNAKTLNLDATDYFCVDAKKILLGEKARTASPSVQQPVVLGKQLENWLGALLDTLSSVADAMSSASAVGAGPVTQLNATGPALKATVQSLKAQFKVFQSKKVFTE